jgi:hypothetical protein
MLAELIPSSVALLMAGAFLFVVCRRGRAKRLPRGAVRSVRITVAIIAAQILITVWWPSRPWWVPAVLPLVAVAASLCYAAPVIARHPEALFSPATIRRWRAIRARPRRTRH